MLNTKRHVHHLKSHLMYCISLCYMKNLHFSCISTETLRKYPILPFLDRKCVCDYKLPDPSGKGTVVLPAGTGVYIPIIAIHNDPEYFSEPEKFDPERFTEETKKSRPNYTYFPFGEGPRICIGRYTVH